MSKQHQALLYLAVLFLLIGCDEQVVEEEPSPIELSVSIIIKGGTFDIAVDNSSLDVKEKASELYEGLDYEITVDGVITNSFYYYSVYNITIRDFTVTINGTVVSSELVSANMPTLLGQNQGMGFTLKFRVDKVPKKTVNIELGVLFDEEL